jgi:hypothetical protein
LECGAAPEVRRGTAALFLFLLSSHFSQAKKAAALLPHSKGFASNKNYAAPCLLPA